MKMNSQARRRAGVLVELELEAEHVRQVGRVEQLDQLCVLSPRRICL